MKVHEDIGGSRMTPPKNYAMVDSNSMGDTAVLFVPHTENYCENMILFHWFS